MVKRRLFCEISPLTFRISRQKCIFFRKLKDICSGQRFAKDKSLSPLSHLIYRHSSLIRRKLGNIELSLQDNKAINLSLAAPKVNGVIIHPGETFSFWQLVGPDSEKRGYKEGLTISNGTPSRGIGGGLCQFTNLIHWMILHSDLTVTEHHHHDGIDLFPDFKRQVPFGTGTSIVFNYLDYRFRNDTSNTYQILVWTDSRYLRGELRAEKPQMLSYHIRSENEYFSEENGVVYRNGLIFMDKFDKQTGMCISSEIIRKNHARVMYDTSDLEIFNR